MEKISCQWENNGFILRLAKPEDATDYYEQNFCPLDKAVVRFTGCKEEFSRREVIDYFLKCTQAEDRYDFLLISPEGRIVGESVLNEIDWKIRCANFRIAIFDAGARGKGIGFWMTCVTRDFAFEKLGLNRIELDVFSFNPRAEQVYLAAGFRREGVRRQSVLDGEEFADDIMMAQLKSEWEACRAGKT